MTPVNAADIKRVLIFIKRYHVRKLLSAPDALSLSHTHTHTHTLSLRAPDLHHAVFRPRRDAISSGAPVQRVDLVLVARKRRERAADLARLAEK
jgi:hypothetical protein